MEKIQKLDMGYVNLAIEELRSKNKKVTLGAISKETGIPYSVLYYSGKLDSYINTHKHQNTVKITTPIDKVALEPEVEVYMQYIRDNYFSHPESIDEVMFDMLATTKFNQGVFNQATNLLKLNNELAESHLKKGYFIGHFIDTNPPVEIIDPTDTQGQSWSLIGCAEEIVVEVPEQKQEAQVQVAKELPSVEMMEMEFELTHGKFRVEFPSQLTTEDVEDMKTLLNMLTKRRIVN